MAKNYRIRENDYPRKYYFAEVKWLWMWHPLHISGRTSIEECENFIKIYHDLNYGTKIVKTVRLLK